MSFARLAAIWSARSSSSLQEGPSSPGLLPLHAQQICQHGATAGSQLPVETKPLCAAGTQALRLVSVTAHLGPAVHKQLAGCMLHRHGCCRREQPVRTAARPTLG